MKITLTLLLCIVLSGVKAQDYLDKITQQSCDCAKNLKDTLDQDRMYLELGLCMMGASEPYKKQLKKDYDINFENIDQEGEKLGRIIGVRMANMCPDVLIKITEKAKKTKAEAGEESFTGKVTKIEKDFFVIFTVKGENKSLKFYWLTSISSNIELLDQYTQLLDQDVSIDYVINSLFDPKVGDYRPFNIPIKIEKLK